MSNVKPTNTVVIDDGWKTYSIQNKEGRMLGSFSFNPSDTNIFHRYNEVVDALEELELSLSKRKDEGKTDVVELFKEAEELVYEKIDYLLNADISQNFFKIMGPFSPLASGQFFIESVLEVIGAAITAETGARTKKIKSKIRKHTGRYHA